MLPPLYARWVDGLLVGPIPEERTATCSDCVMCKQTNAAGSSSGVFFNPETKCCTFQPTLHNFLVGAVLADASSDTAPGRASVEARIAAGVSVSPLGLGRPSMVAARYELAGTEGFGKVRALRCPHYLEEGGGRCGVWRHRESTCATWFCKHDRGNTGKEFWWHLHELLRTVENSLARWAVLRLDVGAAALGALFAAGAPPIATPQELDGSPAPGAQRRVWGNWWGREREFYLEAARLIEPLTWEEVATICGPETAIQVVLVREAYAKLVSDEIPERLRLGPVLIEPIDAERSRVVTYSTNDALDIPRRLVEVLHYFDGRPTSEALDRLADEQRIKLQRELVRRLVDFNVLRPEGEIALPRPSKPMTG
jgi:hypothetical protein